MTDQTDSPQNELGCILATLLVRVWLAMRAIQTGLEKYAGSKVAGSEVMIDGSPNTYGLTEQTATKVYALANYQGIPDSLYKKLAQEPFIPIWALDLFSTLLGPAFLLLGLALLLGITSRLALFGMGLLYSALTFGLILINQSDGIAWLAIHIMIVVAALLLAKYNRLMILKKW
tara:strand:- start:741 stop:1262 length:522 start_codon:yes stop_codon:yes gene_type:complete